MTALAIISVSCLCLLFVGWLGSSITLHHRNVSSAPVDDESFANEEKHNRNLWDWKTINCGESKARSNYLSNGEETPDGGLFHEIIRDQRGQDRTKEEEEASLEDHSLLFIQGKEGSKHQEAVNTSTGNVVGGIGHGYRPSQMVHCVCLKGAKVITTQPLSRWVVITNLHGIQLRNVRQEVAHEQHEASNQTKTLDHNVSIKVLFRFCQTCIDHVAEVWL